MAASRRTDLGRGMADHFLEEVGGGICGVKPL